MDFLEWPMDPSFFFLKERVWSPFPFSMVLCLSVVFHLRFRDRRGLSFAVLRALDYG
jgi:hypothetical protein